MNLLSTKISTVGILSSVTSMHAVFYDATSFNQDINSWDTARERNIQAMITADNTWTWDTSGVSTTDWQLTAGAVALVLLVSTAA